MTQLISSRKRSGLLKLAKESRLQKGDVTRIKRLRSELHRASKESQNSLNKPIGILHHLSCTGGTLLAKCVATQPRTWVLNEIYPFSRMQYSSLSYARFSPTDIVGLLQQGDHTLSDELIKKVFQSDIDLIYREFQDAGRRLILREHSHSRFLHGAINLQQPTPTDVLKNRLPIRSIVTVRNPLDSWLSLEKNGWHRFFSPSNIKEYCRRYHLFLDEHINSHFISYEEFLREPSVKIREICNIFELECREELVPHFHKFSFSGDSGRGGTIIRTLNRRKISTEFANYVNDLDIFSSLIQRINNLLGKEIYI